MTRRQIREQIFMVLFQALFHQSDDIDGQIRIFLDEEETPISDEDREYIEKKTGDIVKILPEIDSLLNEVSEGWSTKRMSRVDLTLLRLAVYEMKYEKLPEGVAINEAVELAKKYGAENSQSFVNGILGKIA